MIPGAENVKRVQPDVVVRNPKRKNKEEQGGNRQCDNRAKDVKSGIDVSERMEEDHLNRRKGIKRGISEDDAEAKGEMPRRFTRISK